jgi:hypothetical protein
VPIPQNSEQEETRWIQPDLARNREEDWMVRDSSCRRKGREIKPNALKCHTIQRNFQLTRERA